MVNGKSRTGCIDLIDMPAHMIAAIEQILCVFLEQNFSFLYDNDFFENIRCLFDNVCGDNKRPVRILIFFQKQVIKFLPRDHVQPGDRLIKDCKICLARQRHNDRHH